MNTMNFMKILKCSKVLGKALGSCMKQTDDNFLEKINYELIIN